MSHRSNYLFFHSRTLYLRYILFVASFKASRRKMRRWGKDKITKFFEDKLRENKLYLFRVEWQSLSRGVSGNNYLKLTLNPDALTLFQQSYQMWISSTLKNDGVLGIMHHTSIDSKKMAELGWNIWIGKINIIRNKLLEEIQKTRPDIKQLPEGVL